MSNNAQRRHGLENFLQDAEKTAGTSGDVRAEVLTNLFYLNLRGNSNDKKFVDSVEGELGQPLPLKPNSQSVGEHTVYWLGPEEWLICSDSDNSNSIGQRIQAATDKLHVAINDVSGGTVTISLTGDGVRRLLSKGCTIDFHPDEFKAGDCAQSMIAKTNVVVGRSKDGLAYDIHVRRSFADYLALWLQKAASDSGIEFRQT